MSLGLFLAIPAQALSDPEIDSLVDEGARMKALMLRMQTQLSQPALPGGRAPEALVQGGGISLNPVADSPWVTSSAMLEGSLKDRWFHMIERGVLGRFAASALEQDLEIPSPAVVGFVQGDEIPWYGSLQVRGYGETGATDSIEAKAHLMVAPRFEDGSFLHVGLSFQSFSHWEDEFDFGALLGEEAAAQGFGRRLAFDVGYAQESYTIQAQYRKSSVRSEGLPFRYRATKANTDGFHIRGAWRIMGEQIQSGYAPSLLAHIEPRDEEGIWELVVRYANLDNRDENNDRNSMLLGIHWHASSTLGLELDYVEGNGEDFQTINDSGLMLRGTLSF